MKFSTIQKILFCSSFLMLGCASRSVEVSSTNAADRAEHLFEILDVDGDGTISRTEARGGFSYLVASYDRGGRTEILAAKPGQNENSSYKLKKPKRQPSQQDANRAFEAMFENSSGASKAADTISKDQFKKLVVRASDNPETDPFAAFY